MAKKRSSGGSGSKGLGVRGIRVKLIAIILALSIIPLAIMTFALTKTIRSTVMELETKIAEQRLATAQKEVISLIDNTFNGVDVLAKNDHFDDALKDPSPENLAEAKRAITDAQDAFSQGATFEFLYDTKGMQIVRGDDNDLNDISERAYVQNSLAGSKYLSDVTISKVSGQPTVYMADPVKDGNDNILGGFAKSADLASLSEGIASITDADTDITVLDRVGVLAATTEEQYNLQSGETTDLSGEEYYQLASANGSGMKVTMHNGKKVLMSYVHEPNTNWTIVCLTDYSSVIAPFKHGLMIALVILVIAVVLVIVCGLAFAGQIAKPIVEVKEFADSLSKGDFTIEPLSIRRTDEIGQMANALNRMYESNSSVIFNIGEGSGKVSNSSAELSETSQDLLARFEEVASSMERVNDAMTSTGAATQQVSASANEVNESVERLAEETANTKREVIEITKKAAEIEKEGRESSEYAIRIAQERGKELEEATEAARVVSEIATMADSIAGIANQINLLSLNASIEAARAGEHGRGFAVVAGEINNLAAQTKSSVEQIQDTVDKIQTAFDSLQSSSMELLSFLRETVAPDYEKFITIGQEYGADAKKFGELADNIAEMVGYISDSMDQVNAAVSDIAESATETAGSSAEVTDTIGEAANMMERMSGMANDSQEVSNHLDEIVKQFKLKEV